MPKANVNIDIEGASLRLGEATAAHVAAIGKADIIGLRLSEAKAELAAKETARGAVIQGLATGAGTATEDKPGTQVAIKSANQGVVDAQGRVATMQAVHDQALANAKAAESDKIRAQNAHTREMAKVSRLEYADSLNQVATLANALDLAMTEALARGETLVSAKYLVDALTPSRAIAVNDDTVVRLDKLCACLAPRILRAVIDNRPDYVSHAELASWHRAEVNR